jgi:transposase IS66 family protein
LNHLPLYRLEQMAAREQVTLSRSTLAEWVDRSDRHAQNFLENWQEHLLADDYGGYKALFSRTTSPCTELACWAHACCKFFDLHQANNSPMALSAAAYRHLIRNRGGR